MYHVLRGGCDTNHPSSFNMSRPKGVPFFVLLIIHSAGLFTVAGKQFTTVPGSALVVAPNTPYSYTTQQGNYVDDWLHFELPEGQNPSDFFPCLNVPFPLKKREQFTQLLRQLLWEVLYTTEEYKRDNINALFTVLINHLKISYYELENVTETSPYQTQLQALRFELSNSISKAHSIKEHAKELGVSESYFQHLYSNFFGISFQKDLISMRIDHAKSHLLTTDLTIEQIAEICGYSNEVHFYRQFKSVTGVTPAKFRKADEITPMQIITLEEQT